MEKICQIFISIFCVHGELSKNEANQKGKEADPPDDVERQLPAWSGADRRTAQRAVPDDGGADPGRGAQFGGRNVSKDAWIFEGLCGVSFP